MVARDIAVSLKLLKVVLSPIGPEAFAAVVAIEVQWVSVGPDLAAGPPKAAEFSSPPPWTKARLIDTHR
jgi:hypothetical protein